LKHQIPVKVFWPWDEQKAGFCEIDTVSHDGGNSSGEYADRRSDFTLTVTDIATQWTEERALKNKVHRWVKEAMEEVSASFPVPLRGIGSDNGGEFINTALKAWCEQREITFTRTRSYRKKELGLKPLVRIVDAAAGGVEPALMGLGPIPAVRKLLKRTGITVDEIGLIELNEAFASQSLANIRELGLDINRINVNGGAIALGHPIGASGCIITIKLINEMIRRKERFGLATLCIGGGQGLAVLFELYKA
jgi:hypothetical protein